MWGRKGRGGFGRGRRGREGQRGLRDKGWGGQCRSLYRGLTPLVLIYQPARDEDLFVIALSFSPLLVFSSCFPLSSLRLRGSSIFPFIYPTSPFSHFFLHFLFISLKLLLPHLFSSLSSLFLLFFPFAVSSVPRFLYYVFFLSYISKILYLLFPFLSICLIFPEAQRFLLTQNFTKLNYISLKKLNT